MNIRTKKFKGRVFSAYSKHVSRSTAEDVAKERRRKGWNARVRKVKDWWVVFVTRKE